MSLQTWQEVMTVAYTDGAALGNSTSIVSLVPAYNLLSLPPNWWYIGRKLHVTATGRISNIVTTPGTLTLSMYLGSVIVATGGAMTLNVVAKTNVPWYLDWTLTCRAVGATTTANLFHQGTWTSEAVVGSPLPSAGGAGTHLLPNAAPAVGTGFDSTAAQVLDMRASWSIANAGNTIQVHQYRVEALT
jgi:hypothetical protein